MLALGWLSSNWVDFLRMTKKMTEKTQRERFEETARQLECDEDEAKFNTDLKKDCRFKKGRRAKRIDVHILDRLSMYSLGLSNITSPFNK